MREQRFIQLGARVKLVLRRYWERVRRLSPVQRRLVSGALGLLVIVGLGAIAIAPRITSASEMNALANGGFEHGFQSIQGCGDVGAQWGCFTNGGAANFGFYDDQWDAVVAAGEHSQLIEINTKDMPAGDNDRYAGIYQTARVVPGAKYKLSLRGMIRTSNKEGDPWRYSVQVGWLPGARGDWREVENWTDVGWNTYYGLDEPSAFNGFETTFIPDAEAITVFIRVWKKWGVAYEELNVNLDEIALVGPPPRHDIPDRGPSKGIGGPVQPGGPHMDRPDWGPEPVKPGGQHDGPRDYRAQAYPVYDDSVSCGGPDLIYNGSFEQGFVETGYGHVGRGWEAFTNGGAVRYGFYDEEWDVVIADGHHGQLIEISSKSVYPTDGDRYAGIYQRLKGLHPGAVYELTLRGGLRGEGGEEDPYRFAAQYAVGTDADWRRVDSDDWHELDLGPIYKRTEPGPLVQATVRFKAPAQHAVLFIRGWKKWGITNQEMDFNLDAIRLRACDPVGPNMGGPDKDGPNKGGPNMGGQPEKPAGGIGGPVGASCLYIVKPGDTLSQIAQKFGVDGAAIMRANGIQDANLIYVGQKFEIPGCDDGKGSKSGMDESVRMPQERTPERPQGGEMGRPTPQEPTPDERKGSEPMMMQPEQRPMPRIGQSPDVRLAERSGELMPAMRQETPVAAHVEPSRSYMVEEGDMLSQIALEYDVNVYDLAMHNGLDNMNHIYAGQVLLIP